uniref:Right handed beta helix domain-containing protein n=1 Tax=Grammatophora oceanica TaxID=210454 RepID=A0A7S1YJQ8_9STRA|mmetsp:Transcript_53257/g.79544  ORF Transcript_53257/g.79544 Transcript_53257/m.79544 type:complete len:376 (+) Transcript_53257:85-1212(+)
MLTLSLIAICSGLWITSTCARTITVSSGASRSVIQSAINSANSGDTVLLEGSYYSLTSPLTFKSGIAFKGQGMANTKIRALNNDVTFELNKLDGVTFSDLKLVGIDLVFTGDSAHTQCLNNKVLNCHFKNSKSERFITYNYCKGGRVKYSLFERTSSSYLGKVIKLFRSHDIVIRNNEMKGQLETAINIGGGLDTASEASKTVNRSYNIDIYHNIITRTGGSREDHGIYAIAFKDLLIYNNTISGWSPTGAGGAVKARNGEDIRIKKNAFKDSGVLLYVYNSKHPKYLKDVVIQGNTMTISGSNSAVKARGVSYWSDFDGAEEKDFFIEYNVINNGCIKLDFNKIDVPAVNGAVRNNQCPIINLKSGITNSGNTN